MKYALITGASSGIGWHIAEKLAERGYAILAVSKQEEGLAKLQQALAPKYSISIRTLYMDLASAEAAKEVFDYCVTHQLEVEVLVNNAGMLVAEEVVQVPYKKVAAILQLHMITTALLCRLFGGQMAKQHRGYILNVSSISAVMPYPIISLYGPSKTFIRSFSRALRTEMLAYRVKVSCLLPGATATALYDPNQVNIPLAMKLGIMHKAEKVATRGVKALFKGRGECIPGFLNKLIIFIMPLIPIVVIRSIYKLYKFKYANKSTESKSS